MTCTVRFSGESTSTLTNIPGRRRPSGFGNVARTRTFRVLTSTSGLITVTPPSQVAFGNTSVRSTACIPSLSSARACCGSQNSPCTGCTAVSEAIAVPEASTCPSSTCRIETRPSNGARMVFLAMFASRVTTFAAACFARASAASRSAGELTCASRSVLARCRLARARSASALAAASCPCSVELSSFTSKSPLRTNMPESKPISRTRPGTSEARVTVRTAISVPTVEREACHSTASTLAEVTDSGGMAKDLPALIILPIWPALIPARMTTTATSAAFALVALNGFFVATEFALVKVRPTRLDELARRGSGGARRTRRIVDRLDEYLSATQLGITLASLALGWIGEPAFAHLIEPVATRAGLAPPTTEGIAAALSFLLITFLHIVFGELAPKSLAIQRPEGTALAVSAPMHWFHVVFYPAIWALNAVAAAALRLIGLKSASESETIHTEEELRLIVASMRSGKAGSRRLDVVERTLRLPQRVSRDLMVPRQDIAYFRLDQTLEERREIARKTWHSRYPVIESDIDHIAGIFNVRDAFVAGSDPRTPEEMRALLRPPLYVPESMSAEALFRELRGRKQRLAIVVDEYGGTAGIVTVQDLIDAIAGETGDGY